MTVIRNVVLVAIALAVVSLVAYKAFGSGDEAA
jgi:hypothetical protein